jgi:uracil-DNA glycosylase family 4
MVRQGVMRNYLDAARWYALMGIDYYIKDLQKLSPNEPLESSPKQNEKLLESVIPSDISDDVQTSMLQPEDSSYLLQEEQELMDFDFVPKVQISDVEQARCIADNVQDLSQLRKELSNFDLCTLKFGAKNLVFADGNKDAQIMLIGEAPGATEDEMGIPFCGLSGNLLDNMLAAIGLFRAKNFYITNTVFWRPPDNRQPTAEEIEICRPFVEKHIALVKPKIIVLVGGVAVASLLGPQMQISKIRGNIYNYSNPYISNISTTAIFHPAYLVRQPLKKKTAWFDLLHLKKIFHKNGILY